jgi:HK97 family phage major capsid protein
MTYTPNKTSDQDSAFLAPEVAALLDTTVKAKAVIAHASQLHSTNRPSVDFPLFTTAVSTGFIGELDDLPLSNADTGSVNVPAYKVAGATQVSSETLDDMDPDIAAMIGTSLADQTIHSLDSAFFAASTTKGFVGLLGQSYQSQDTGAASFTQDDIIKAVYLVNGAGGIGAPKADTLILPVTSAEQLSLTKVGTGYNTYALPLIFDGSPLEGLKVIVSDLVDADTFAWVLDSTKNRLVLRKGTQITRTYVPQNDSWFISSVSRYGWDSLNDDAIVRVWNATP